MSVYTGTYGPFYGVGGTFPQAPLDAAVELDVGGWTDITSYAVQQSAIAASITRGRQNETTQATPSTCAMKWNNIDARFDPDNPVGPYYGLLGLNTPVRVSVPDDTTYLRLADDNQSWTHCAASTPLELGGNIDARIDMRLDDYQPCTLAGQWGSSSATWGWCLLLNGDSTLSWVWYDTTSVNSVQSTQPLPYLGRVAVRCYFEASAGQVTFWTAPDMGGTFTQLGAAIPVTADDYAQAVSHSVQVGYVNQFAAQDIVSSGCLGQVYEFALYNATPALVADPRFYNQAAGATSFTDGQGNTWDTEGTAELSDRSFRGHFECSSLPEEWDPAGHDIWTPAAASGVLRRIQAGNSPAPSVMRRTVSQQPSVVAYWPAEDAQGASVIASGLPGGLPMSFASAPGFQGTAGSPSADTVFPCSAQVAQVQNSAWSGTVPPYTSAGNDGCPFLLYIPAGTVPNGTTLVNVAIGGHSLSVVYSTAAGGELSIQQDGTTISGSPLTAVNGVPMLAQLGNGSGTATLTILPAGGGETTRTATGTSTVSGPFRRVLVNQAAAACGATEIGHIWVTPDAPDLTTLQDALNAWTGEAAAARFARLCAENSLQCRIFGPPDLSVAMGPQPIDTVANLLQYCEDADRGVIFEPRTVLGLGYRTSHTLCAQSPAVVFDYSAGEVSPPLKPVRDDLNVRNDQVITRNNGSSVQVQVTTGPLSVLPPPAGAGDYQNSLTVYCETDSQLPDIAGWMAWAGTAPGKRYPVIYADLASTDAGMQALIPALRDADIGDYLQIVNTPQPLLPPGTVGQLAWGVKEDIGDFAWRMQFNAVPESPYEVFVLDDPVFGHLDTDGATLASGVSSTATTLSVATTNPASPLWTTNSGDFPFDIGISGEQITVTNITGSSSPQSFTVVRSVNGVVKAQASGAAVALFHPPVLALA